MKKVIITGATGMIGNALLNECLKKNIEILAIVRPNSKNINRIPKSPLIKICECDLENIKNIDFSGYGSDWDVFYHFAWNFTSSQYRNDVKLQYQNIEYTLDTLEISKKLGCKKYVGAGSQAEYGFLNLDKIAPDSPANPITAYGIAKLAAGKMALLWAEQNKMDCIWARIFSVYGKYDLSTTMISSSISKILKGEKTSFTAGIQLWDYLYSSDAGKAFYLIGEKSTGSKVYCIGSGKTRPLREYIKIMGKKINPSVNLGIGQIPYNNDKIVNLCADITSLICDTGFTPLIDFDKGIEKTIQFVKCSLEE